MSAAGLVEDVARIASRRVLADVHDSGGGESARQRLEAALGLDFAERLVDALSSEALDRLGVALKSPPFAALLAGALAKERSEAVQRDA